MKNVYSRFILVAMLVTAGVAGLSQNYPTQATLQLTPPYSLYLQDYVSEDNRLAAMVFLKDLNRPEYRVRFRFTIEGNGVNIVTNPNYLPPPTILQGGVPLSLSGPELAEYFNPFNLVFTGITRQEFQKTGRLPEGPYRFCLEVVDYNIGVPVSNASCHMLMLMLNDPPMINVPLNDTKVRETQPQNLVFQWTPRHTASPNAANSTEYYFRMVEVWPRSRNPFDALNTGTPFFETVTTQTALIYSLADPPLVPGRRYAFRVQARQKEGATARDMFKNNGYSEVFTFTYGDCPFPPNLQVESPYPDRARVSWDNNPANSGYVLLYKETGTGMAWREQNVLLTHYTLTSLKPGTSYDFQIAGQCDNTRSSPSAILTQTTPQLNSSSFECGRLPAAFNLNNTLLLADLAPGTVIRSGDFEVEVTEATGSNGTFTGKGSLLVPFLNYAKVQVVFQAITINTDQQVIKGNITVTGIGL